VATVEVSKFAGILSAALSQHHVPIIHWKYCVNGIVLIHIVFLLVMASGPITSWQIDRETIEMVRLYLGHSQITEDGDYSHEIKRHLLLGRKAMTNLDSILRSRDVTVPTRSI